MNLTLFDDLRWNAFLPFTHTRPVADIRCGILTMRERWEHHLQQTGSNTLTREALQRAFPLNEAASGNTLLANSRVFCTEGMALAARALEPGQKLMAGETILAACCGQSITPNLEILEQFEPQVFHRPVDALESVTDIFSGNSGAITGDFEDLIGVSSDSAVPPGVIVSGSGALFIHPEATIGAGVIMNRDSGPIYIGKGAEVMEGCLIRGPFVLCAGATLKMGTKVYGGTTIGPNCKVGGEVSNVVFFANSNKGHDGFLGNAVIGEWCNLGADTNCSNLKNNYDEVKIWDEAQMKGVKTGLTFCGLLMGDHSKCGINTMFNTGTVVGVSCNIWGGGFPEKFVPSFSWGGPDGMTTYSFARAADTANRMMARRGKALSAAESDVLQNVFDKTKAQRDLLHSS